MNPVREVFLLRTALVRLEARLNGSDAAWHAREATVSSWSVAQQVDHALRAAQTMLAAAASLAPEGAATAAARAARARLNLPGRVVLWLGRIPRGRGQAPAAVLPGTEPERELARGRLSEVRTQLDALAPRATELARWPGALPHPALGRFAARHWLRFAPIHTEHHLAIVDDILRAQG